MNFLLQHKIDELNSQQSHLQNAAEQKSVNMLRLETLLKASYEELQLFWTKKFVWTKNFVDILGPFFGKWRKWSIMKMLKLFLILNPSLILSSIKLPVC